MALSVVEKRTAAQEGSLAPPLSDGEYLEQVAPKHTSEFQQQPARRELEAARGMGKAGTDALAGPSGAAAAAAAAGPSAPAPARVRLADPPLGERDAADDHRGRPLQTTESVPAALRAKTMVLVGALVKAHHVFNLQNLRQGCDVAWQHAAARSGLLEWCMGFADRPDQQRSLGAGRGCPTPAMTT